MDDTHIRTDPLSAIGRQLLKLDAEKAYTKLLVDGPGNELARTSLESLSSRDLIDGPVEDSDEADALLSALWLRHDWLEQSHKISQRIETPAGAMWHAIMHRREGDFSNSKYWYRQANGHAASLPLSARANEVINPFPADKTIFRITAGGWNPSALVDLVEQVHNRPDDPRHRLAVALQHIEWQTLFEHCTRSASGK
ncbi:MAG TPA: hypothetical protein VHD56_12855 [Tepidisphaeraceae bacterium]|nr:hypothetical protein [Tepidisphaeraceae bacterium]